MGFAAGSQALQQEVYVALSGSRTAVARLYSTSWSLHRLSYRSCKQAGKTSLSLTLLTVFEFLPTVMVTGTLVCSTVRSGRWVRTFRENLLLSLSRSRSLVLHNCSQISTLALFVSVFADSTSELLTELRETFYETGGHFNVVIFNFLEAVITTWRACDLVAYKRHQEQ